MQLLPKGRRHFDELTLRLRRADSRIGSLHADLSKTYRQAAREFGVTRATIKEAYRLCQEGKEAEAVALVNKERDARIREKEESLLREDRESVVYFVEAKLSGKIKIGVTSGLGKRLRNLINGSPIKLRLIGTIPGTYRDEQDLHLRFAKYRKHGEWFSASTKLKTEISQILMRGSAIDDQAV